MRPWKATLGEFFGGPSIEEHGRPVDLEDPQYSFQLYLGCPPTARQIGIPSWYRRTLVNPAATNCSLIRLLAWQNGPLQ